jgi:hypothetical protein
MTTLPTASPRHRHPDLPGQPQDIPQSLLDAAAIDGASTLQRFRHVTLLLLTPVWLFLGNSSWPAPR